MNKLVLAICLVSSLTIISRAQTTNSQSTVTAQKGQKHLTPEQRAKRDADMAQQKLGLSAEQKVKWEEAGLDRIRRGEPIKTKMRGPTTPEERKELQSQMEANKERYLSTIAAILTPEQKVKYDQFQKEREERVKAMRQNRQQNSTH